MTNCLLLEKNEKPSLILLDYNSSPMNAVEILNVLKNHEYHRLIPVVVRGDSTSEKYVNECYANGASSYATKPASILNTEKKIRVFFDYWLSVAEV